MISFIAFTAHGPEVQVGLFAYDFTGQNQGINQSELLLSDSGDESDSKLIQGDLRIQFLAFVEL